MNFPCSDVISGRCPGSIKKWPKDQTELVKYKELMDPIMKSLKFAYRLVRKNKDKDIPYDGYDMENISTVPSPDKLLSTWNFERLAEYGMRPIDALFHIAFLMGYEQGKRRVKKDLKLMGQWKGKIKGLLGEE